MGRELPQQQAVPFLFLGFASSLLGRVNLGDYILPGADNNGVGFAVHPDAMKIEDYQKIVGIAWSELTNDGFSMVNVAVGVSRIWSDFHF